MECHDVRLLLTFAQRGCENLDAAERAALQRHLEQCPECASLAQADGRLDETISQLMRDVPVPAGLRERVLTRLAAERRGSAWKHVVGAALAAALLIAVGVTAWHWHARTDVNLDTLKEYVYQGREFNADQIKEYFARQGLSVRAPSNFKLEDLLRIDVVEFQGRRVARLYFSNVNAAADVLILPAAQFNAHDLRPGNVGGLLDVYIEVEGDFTYVIIMHRGVPGNLKPDLQA